MFFINVPLPQLFCGNACLYENVFPLKLFIFIWDSMNYFFIVKVVVASSQYVQIALPHDVTENIHCQVTMGRWRWPGNYMTTSLIPKIHVTNVLDRLHNIQENLDLLCNIQAVGKHGYVTSQTGSSHTLPDMMHYCWKVTWK